VLLLLLLVSLFAGTFYRPAEAAGIGERVDLPFLLNYGGAGGASSGGFDAGGQSLRFLRLPISSEPLVPGDERRWGLRLRFELSLGVYDFFDLVGGPGFDSVKAVTLLPGFAVPIALHPGFVLVPFVDLGSAYVSEGGGWAFLARTGMQLEAEHRRGELLLLARPKLEYLWSRGERPALNDEIGSIGIKLGARHPTPLAPRGHRIDFGAYGEYEYFYSRVDLLDDGGFEVEHQLEFGGSLGTAESLRLWFFDLPRLSAGYRFGDGVAGVRVRLGGRF